MAFKLCFTFLTSRRGSELWPFRPEARAADVVSTKSQQLQSNASRTGAEWLGYARVS